MLFRSDGVWLGAGLPGLTTVVTDSNMRFSVSGYTPLVIPD